MWHTRGGDRETISLDVCDQHKIQGDLFSLAVLNGTAVPMPLEAAVANMRVIEQLKRTASSRSVI
jgi:hypothetical protein